MNFYLLAAAFAAPLLVAVPVQARAQSVSDSRGHFETTPGPRGTTQWVTTTPRTAREKIAKKKSANRLVQLPGPRGGTRLVETKSTDPMTRQAAMADCDCSMMNDASAKMPCKMSMPTQPAKAG